MLIKHHNLLRMFQYGIEHEVAFINCNGKFADFTNTKFSDFQNIVDQLPYHESDYPQLRVGDAGIKLKRWYIEGFERFSETGDVTDCVPKGIEIRTTIHKSIHGVITELNESMELLKNEAEGSGFTPIGLSFNPNHTKFDPVPPLNTYELKRRNGSPEKQTAHIPMLTYGPDLSISLSTLSTREIIDVGKKLTYYSPFIIPFSFSIPEMDEKKWKGYSYRTYVRTGRRPAVMVFLRNKESLIESNPSLTQLARVPAEAGRIEFKAFDSCRSFDTYASLLGLLKGLILDNTLSGRALIPDRDLHQLTAKEGLDNKIIYSEARKTLQAAYTALNGDADQELLIPLINRLEKEPMAFKKQTYTEDHFKKELEL